MQKAELQKLVSNLSNLGEDAKELNLWLNIYDDLQPDEQEELTANLQDELKKLERIKNSKTIKH